MCPTLSFPVSREKVQGLGSGRFVSIGEWWGSGDRLWSLMEFFVHFVCNIFVCSCSVVGGGCGIHVSNDERGTVFDTRPQNQISVEKQPVTEVPIT